MTRERQAAAIERARQALAERRRTLDRTIPRHRGEVVREMYAIVRDSLSRYGGEVADEAGRDFIPNYRRRS